MDPSRVRAVAQAAGISPAEAVALLVLLLGALALTAVAAWPAARPGTPGPADPGDPAALAGLPGATAAPEDGVPAPLATAARVLVHVTGEVAQPGVVDLPDGARIADAIAAAGGVLPAADTTTLNLARPLRDGEQVVVGAVGDPPPVAEGQVATATTPDGRLDLNLATADDLQALPGIGPVTAERIISHREAIGGFSDVTQLLEVSGIGPTRFASLEPLVVV